ncbi:NAD+ kinase [Marchantia polymorpha subsp. ruderalis]|uniref:NAD(+) kinase n=2 Tax=Marchantia polymorpha TaxID=3197 RepID=A0AAF6BCN9_MARPO|nr:hypothetical protein MARPO_0020s0027 [Marchantia polymorpha]BBN09773.1 hypothetical protein Mp_4g22570 [Marchantia polymorpha subsp. ruderalis]|eukprot:PTQ44355.1 hypothetical protein MARPO_0020s0027 [Marchantia polymorpha]
MGPSSTFLCSQESSVIRGGTKGFLVGKPASWKAQRVPGTAIKRNQCDLSSASNWSRRQDSVIKFKSCSSSIISSSRWRAISRVQQGSIKSHEIQVVYRRGYRRAFCSGCHWLRGDNEDEIFSGRPRMNRASSSRKKLRCLAYDGDSGEPPSVDWTALASIEQAIQFQAREESRLFWFGPPTGDLAEIEAFCRLHRHAESLHTTVMDALRSYSAIASSDVGAGPDRGDVSLVEENVAAGLAHIMSLLHIRKTDLLCSTSVGRPQEEAPLDEPPPFAKFRSEVRECCRPLETALESLLPADSVQRLAVRRSMLKLKNACLDSGFMRPDGLPKHADIPNLAVVRLRPSKNARALHKDEDVAFWRGGQVTEEGLEWLLTKGFKTIVDMREESAQPIAQSAIENAVASGKISVVRLPVERGEHPTKEQVEEFAGLVADAKNKPLYLHTRAGVGRASAMVSCWREHVLREKARERREKKVLTNGTAVNRAETVKENELEKEKAVDLTFEVRAKERDAVESSTGTNMNGQVNAMLGSQVKDVPEVSASNQIVVKDSSSSEVRSVNGKAATTPRDAQVEEMPAFVLKNAFEAQRPPSALSRPALSRFMKQKKNTSMFLSGREKAASKSSYADGRETLDMFGNLAGPAGRWGLASPGIPRAENKAFAEAKEAKEAEEKSALGTSTRDETAVVGGEKQNGYAKADKVYEREDGRDAKNDQEQNDEETEQPSTETKGRNGALFQLHSDQVIPEEGEEPVVVEGDMCASTTGVVRLQSRKKAEMFLVRTDGYSCTRERVKESTLAFTHPSTQQQMLMWKTPPRTCLILKKLGDELLPAFQQVASFLHHQEGMNVVVEPEVHDRLARLPGYGFVQTFYSRDTSELHERVDFVVCLGGDGVILHASNLFRSAVPPVVSFNLGSLGFLTAHPFKEFKEDLRAIIHGHSEMMTGVYITLRMRLRCELYRNGKAIPGKVFDVLNEVVVDRGSNPYLSKIECYERNRLITKVQADGVIVATPTGSTAYSTAAGGSMVHPNVPCMLFTPICPHSLSFRPVILPDSALLELKVPRDARNNAWVCFDGKKRQQLSKGDSVRICMSEHPLPTVNKNDQTDDWFQSLVRCLNWNERLEQRPLNTPS